MAGLTPGALGAYPGWHRLFLRGVAAVADHARRRAFGALLPPPSGAESYADYLTRLPPDAGLLAE